MHIFILYKIVKKKAQICEEIVKKKNGKNQQKTKDKMYKYSN